jgi:hypothetical protein
MGLLGNCIALARWGVISSKIGRAMVWAVAMLWVAIVLPGLWKLNNPAELFPMLAHEKTVALEQRLLVAEVIATKRTDRLEEFATRTNRFSHLNLTLDLLRDDKVKPFLPPSMVPANQPGPLAQPARQIAAMWFLMTVCGLAGFGAAVYQFTGRSDPILPGKIQ